MKLKNIAKKGGKEINLDLVKENKLIAPNQEFEVADERAEELLKKKIDNAPIVEQVKEAKPKSNKED